MFFSPTPFTVHPSSSFQHYSFIHPSSSLQLHTPNSNPPSLLRTKPNQDVNQDIDEASDETKCRRLQTHLYPSLSPSPSDSQSQHTHSQDSNDIQAVDRPNSKRYATPTQTQTQTPNQ
ncbi:hypothetical protein D9758_010551 [Tetrapyrgos nigripes]|uniref:Uncharacterized protein n=1 Tax=Tetrapyrgos nigripes TaxID=182062 RepID=A0A8H5CZG5_9AGAR|nr:hypothetical protein D9758_010551 [Tetrapyrgos nigripes]